MLASTPMSLSVKCALLRGHVCVNMCTYVCMLVGYLCIREGMCGVCVCV
jgi:hypothetical protein